MLMIVSLFALPLMRNEKRNFQLLRPPRVEKIHAEMLKIAGYTNAYSNRVSA